MRLFWTSFLISCKHSGRGLLCLLCIFAVCGGLGFAAMSALPERSAPAARVAVLNLDENPVSRMSIKAFTSMRSVESLMEVSFIGPEEKDLGRYAAVLTIPEGFVDSVMNGENLAPLIEINLDNPLEAMWVRQMARAGAAYLTAAQLGVYTVQEGVEYGAGMTPRAYDALLFDVNMAFVNAFTGRLRQVESQMLSASGALPLPLYYAAALVTLLFFCYGFLFQPMAAGTRAFSTRLRGSGKRAALFAACTAHLLALTLAAAVPVFLLACRTTGFTAGKLGALLLFTLLSGLCALLLCLLPLGRAACAAVCILLAAGMGMCAGGFLPLALMPPAFSRLAPLLPVGQGMRLWRVILGEPSAAGMVRQALAMCAVLLMLCVPLWRRGGREAA